jgi:hypothetical protein
LFCQISCQKNEKYIDDKYIEEKSSLKNSEVYRCTVTHSFRKTTEGKKVNTIFFSVPKSNDYQEISNYYFNKGEILFDTITNEFYLKWDLSNDNSTESGEWFKISFEFDYIAKSTEFKTQVVGEIYPYKPESTIHKMYTSGWYNEIDLKNTALLNVSKEIWDKSTDIYDYARKCFEYVDVNFYYTDKYNYSVPLTFLLELGAGNCFQFSQILITLLRMKNIPARYVRTWQHTWAEFYLENYGWIPADPTFSLFGIAPSGYSKEIVWNSNMTYHVENPSETPNNSHCYGIHHVLPNDNVHKGYECDMSWPMVMSTSVTTKDLENKVCVFPNPASHNIRIKGNGLHNTIDYKILDLSGKLVKQDRVDFDVIEVSGLKKGIYMLQLEIDNELISKKINIK